MDIGNRIAAWRGWKGWTQQGLAKKIGVTRAAVYQWESGATMPLTGHVQKVARLCGVSMETFYGAIPKRAA